MKLRSSAARGDRAETVEEPGGHPTVRGGSWLDAHVDADIEAVMIIIVVLMFIATPLLLMMMLYLAMVVVIIMGLEVLSRESGW